MTRPTSDDAEDPGENPSDGTEIDPTESADDSADSNGEPAIVATDLTRVYGETTAVSGLDLEVDVGSVYGLLGPNGAGKTTTIRMLTALTPPTRGSGTVAGVPITDRESLVDRVGYLPESPPIYEQLTAREQLEYYGGLCGMDASAIEARMEPLLERLDLAADADDRIVTYSKGMRRKTGLVQAILPAPDVVFLDEPTAGLDPRAARTVRELVTELADAGTTVVLSTHILSVVETVATEVGILRAGELVAEGAPKDLRERLEERTDPTLEDVVLEVTTDAE
ncbi:ABC transporter ATP-binding protein [Natronococcus occultus]|uniref:ABC-type multidrug transport system, ATPase component n=1 Tax=Natronococcus occultus SP4 TaxID=694430 RepID=L0K084_9EURY|nr:ABC transporter ATP-binding protein [Natronococcus occultus]AGB38401.1 ABC-type multidrug transport system, ATPase component [Natronococcus occultus SP4]